MSAREIIAGAVALLVVAYLVWRWRKVSLERKAIGVVVVLVLGGLLALGFKDTEKQPVTVEKAMLNDAQAK